MVDENSSIEAQRKRLQTFGLSFLVVLFVLAVMGWLLLPVYHHYKERRTQSQAQTFLAAGDFRNALLCARQALQLNPSNVPACKIMAALADVSHNPLALDWQRKVVQAEPSVENKLQLAAAGLRYQTPPYPLTAQILSELSPVATNLASYHVTAAGLALSLRRSDEAERHLEIAAQLEPTNQLYGLNLAVLRLAGTNETEAAQSRATLENIRSDANLGPVALRALVVDRLAHKDVAAAEVYSTQLLANDRVMLIDRLQHLGILRELRRSDFEAALRALQQNAVTNSATVAQVAEWMQANRLVTEEIQWLTNLPVVTRGQSAVRVALADAYLEKADWQSLHDLTSKEDWSEMNFLRLALASRAWRELGAQVSADSNWDSAINEAGNRYGALITLLGLTERWNLQRERELLLGRIVEKFPRERWAGETLEKILVAEGKTAQLNALYSRLFAFFPENLGYKNNFIFTSLLMKTNLSEATRRAEENFAEVTNPTTVSTYAFSLWLNGRAKDGLAVMRGLTTEQLEDPDTAFYFGLVLQATGEIGEAKKFLNIAQEKKTLWLPEEKKLLAEAMR